jgi:hypothetical protein
MNEYEAIHERVVLEWMKFVSTAQLSPGILFRSRPQLHGPIAEDITKTLFFEIEAQVLGKRLPDKTVESDEILFFEYPASPFQHWKLKHKDSWWLRWFIRRYPIIIAEKAKGCRLEVRWSMAEIYPEQGINTDIGRKYIVIDRPVSRSIYWEPPVEY